MRRTAAHILFVSAESYRFLGRLVSALRWVTIGAVLLIALLQPAQGRTGLPIWLPILAFAAYSLLSDLIRRWMPTVRSFTWMAILDLPVAGLIYFLGTEGDDLFFALFFVTVVSASATLRLVGGLLYAAAVALIMVAIHLWLPAGANAREQFQNLAARLVLLVIVAVATGLLTRRLALQEAASEQVHADANRLEALNRSRVDFIATVSHSLRTPLTAIQAGVGLLATSAKGRLRDDEQELLANVRRNIVNLGRLMDDLLAFNQLEAGILPIVREPVDLRIVALEAVAGAQALLEYRGQTVETNLPNPLPALGDRRSLQQVMTDLLANANLHTPPGTHIIVGGRVDKGQVLLSVRDNGPGIPTKELETIFQRTYRLAPGVAGSGLGLAIVRAIVEGHGGRVWAESTPGEGITFSVTLPYQEGGDVL